MEYRTERPGLAAGQIFEQGGMRLRVKAAHGAPHYTVIAEPVDEASRVILRWEAEADRVISGVYNGVLPVLDSLDLNTENDELQQLVEDFADKVWEWFNVDDEDAA
jgi:hypothetical protein